jgi:hypothetical protein
MKALTAVLVFDVIMTTSIATMNSPPGIPTFQHRHLSAVQEDRFVKYGDMSFNTADNSFKMNESRATDALPGTLRDPVARMVRNMAAVFEIIKINQSRLVAACAPFPALVVAIGSPPAWASRMVRLLRDNGICNGYIIDHRCGQSKEDGARSLSLPGRKPVHYLPHEVRDHRNDARFLDATAAHIFALAVFRTLEVPFALIVEDDIEFMLSPTDLRNMVDAISRRDPFHYSMIGGCRSIHIAAGMNGTGHRLALASLPGGGDLIESAPGSSHGSRCAHAYLVSKAGAVFLLADAAQFQAEKAIDFWLNVAHTRNTELSCTFVEPPVACQIRGREGELVRSEASRGHGKGFATCGATGDNRSQAWEVPLPSRLRRRNDQFSTSMSCMRAPAAEGTWLDQAQRGHIR